MFDLYVMETCPYCRKVMDFLVMNNIEYNKFDVALQENLDKLVELGGKAQVPFLVDGDKMIYESDYIIEYIKEKQ
ncbi:MAG: glutathione S-transferase N-terminal domain-containing protein [Candidatus Gastranaerophilales bacterium]